MKQTSLSLITAMCLSIPALALATPGGKACPPGGDCPQHCPMGDKKEWGGRPMAASMDANKDGKVSFKEFEKAHTDNLKKRFELMDTNGDGFITDQDRDLKQQQRKNQRFNDADSNKDGVLSREEFNAIKKPAAGRMPAGQPGGPRN